MGVRMRKCSTCGFEFPEDGKFCPECGVKSEAVLSAGIKPGIPAVCPMSGQQGGRWVLFEDGQICFGRDLARCQILYHDSAPGVSRFHCTLIWDEGRRKFILSDMNSTYGTFLKSGKRLTPGKLYYLKPGESFYLGDINNEVKTGVRSDL
ncbi:MAG: FHA domain-containing protein [Blautia sp.]|nr:FHA domain-containing protein [Blautia sp.]